VLGRIGGHTVDLVHRVFLVSIYES